MHRTTSLTREQTNELVHQIQEFDPEGEWTMRRLPLAEQVQIAVRYLRFNTTQEFLAEIHNISQPTVSRIVRYLTPVVADALAGYAPDPEQTTKGTTLLIDGTLAPCWSWQQAPELWSGKHRTTGHNIQVAATTGGRLVYISDPLPGKTHDTEAYRQHHLADQLTSFANGNAIGDKGYQGLGLFTPTKKPIGGELTDDKKANNKTINGLRAPIERIIATVKTWRILFTDYRRPLKTFKSTLDAVRGLIFFQLYEPL